MKNNNKFQQISMNINKYQAVSINIRNIYKFLLISLFFIATFFIAAPQQAHAANVYWFGDSGNWSDAANHWSNNSGNSPASLHGAAPGTDDNCYFDANSFTGAGQTVTVDATASCLDMDWTGATNTPTLSFSTLHLYASGNVTFIAAMTSSASGAANLYMIGTGKMLTTNTLSLAFRVAIGSPSVAANITLADALTTTNSFYIIRGVFATADFAVTTSLGISDSASVQSRTLTLGNSTINCVSWSFDGGGSTTLTANTSTINVSGTGVFAGGTSIGSYNNVNLNGTAHTISGSNTFATLTRNGTDTKTDTLTLTAGTTQTITNLNLIGNPAHNYDRLSVRSSTLGSPAILTVTNKPTITQTDLMDIALTNAQDYSGQTDVGDAGGNTGFTFPASAPQNYGGTASFSWSDSTKWTSRIPLPQDDVTFTGAVFTSGRTVTVDMPRIGKSIDFSGMSWSGTATIVSRSVDNSIYGSYILKSGMTYTNNANIFYFRGRGSHTINTNGISLTNPGQHFVYAIGGTYTLQNNFTFGGTGFYLYAGTLDLNGYNWESYNFVSNSTAYARAIYLRTGTMSLWGNGTDAFMVASDNLTLDAGTSTIKLIVGGSATAPTFAGAGLTYYNLMFMGTDTGKTYSITGNNTFHNFTFQGTNTNMTITGSNTFNTFTVDRSQAAKAITFTHGTTQTFANVSIPPSGTNVLTINSDTTATHALVKTGGGTISSDYLNIQHSVATPAYTWYAGANSTNNQATATAGSGWIFSAAYKTLVGKDIGAYQVMTDGTNVYGYINTTNVVSTPLSSVAWHHVVMTYDGATQNLYVDGVLQDSDAVTGAINTNNSNIEIGQNFAGKIDNIRVYNRALSQAEILAANESYNPSVRISDLQKGLVGHWKMDGNAKDSTPYANNGTVTGAVLATDRKGEANKAYNFNGTSNYISVGSGASLVMSGTVSIEAWIKPDISSSTTWQRIVDTYDPGGNNAYVFIFQASTNRLITGYGGATDATQSTYKTSTSVITQNVWTHVVATWSSGTCKIYINGVSVTVSEITGDYATINSDRFTIGAYYIPTTGVFFDGLIDNVRVYNRALSQTEITALYESYDPGIQVSDLQKGLVGHWKFDGNAKDSTPYANNGTLYGSNIALTADRKGQANKAYSFNGTTDYVDCGSSVNTQLQNNFTFEAWVNPTSVTVRNAIMGNFLSSGADYYGIQMDIENNGRLYLRWGDTSHALNDHTYSSAPIGADQWTHIIVVFSTNGGKIYKNGILATTFTFTQASVGITSFKISYDTNNAFYFNGSIDDVRIYNRALSQAEITALYESY